MNRLESVKQAINAGLSSHSIALSIAVGMYGGVFPIWGTQSIVIIAIGAPLGASMVISVAINQLMSGFAIALIPFFIRIGERALFVGVAFDASSLASKLQEDPWGTIFQAQEALLHGVVGWCLLLPCVVVLYCVVRAVCAISSLRNSQGDITKRRDCRAEDILRLDKDPFICDISGALISMETDGRYHFDDGREPEDPAAVCMSVAAFKHFKNLHKEHSDTWVPAYGTKSKWLFIPPHA